jgi:DNA recombination-dependent growth factor C
VRARKCYKQIVVRKGENNLVGQESEKQAYSQRESTHIVRLHSILSSLVPLSHQTNQRTDGTSQTDNAIINVDVAEGRDGDEEIAKVRDELCLSSTSLTVKGQQKCFCTQGQTWEIRKHTAATS